MENTADWKAKLSQSLSSMLENADEVLFGFLKALGIIIAAWLVFKIVMFLVKKILKVVKADLLSDKINEADLFGIPSLRLDIGKILTQFVKWVMILIFVIVGADLLNLTIISEEIANLLRYLPTMLTALVIFMGGLYIARMIKKTLNNLFDSVGIGGSKIAGNVIFYLLAIFSTITALNHAGIDTAIITSNFTIILGAFLFAIALGFGLGSKEIITDLLRTFYARRTFGIGDEIVVKGRKGIIEAIENNTVILKTKNGIFIIPIKDVISEEIELKSEG